MTRSRLALGLALLLALSPSACRKRPKPSPSSPPTRAPPAPPIAEQPSIRNNSSEARNSAGGVVRTRLFVSRLTSNDPIRVAFELAPDGTWDKSHAWFGETFDWGEAVASFRFELTPEGRKPLALETAGKYGRPWPSGLGSVIHELTLDSAGLSENAERVAWKSPPAKLLENAGKFSLRMSGTLKTPKFAIAFETKPLELEVLQEDAQHKSLTSLEAEGGALVQKRESLPRAPRNVAPIVDDVNGNRWLRFDLEVSSGGYDIQVAELLLDPAGNELAYDRFKHFTCVAEGTPIATPAGSTTIERLAPGDAVVAFDVRTRAFTTAEVVDVERRNARGLVRLGALAVTGDHPIFANGRFVRAAEVGEDAALVGLDGQTRRLAPVFEDTQAMVYDLSVSEPHTYFAAGLLVHNKAVHVPIGGAQPWRGWFYRRAAKK